jgi:integrase
MIFNHLVKHHVLTKIPFEVEPMKAPQPHRAFVPIELEPKFFAAIDKSRNLQVMLAVRAMFWLGLRESEALEMRWEGLSWDLMRYTPGSTVFDPTKGGEAQGLPTDQSLRALLWSVIWEDFDGNKPLGGWVIPAEDGLPRRAQFTKKAIARAGRDIRVPGLTPHRLRAGLATNLARAGYGAHHIKKALRHKQMQTSEHYVMLGQETWLTGCRPSRRRRGESSRKASTRHD